MIKQLILLALLCFSITATVGCSAYAVGYGFTAGVHDAKR